MKQLLDLIEQLHNINQIIVEKDNVLDHMRVIIDLLSQLLKDSTLIHSATYAELQNQYFLPLATQLSKLDDCRLVIEPENHIANTTHTTSTAPVTTKPSVPTSKSADGSAPSKTNSRHFTIDDVNGPIRTDIFQAPSCRKTYARKKTPTTATQTTTSPSPTASTVQKSASYVAFTHAGQEYYIMTTPTSDATYSIFDHTLKLAGQLHHEVVTLLIDSDYSHPTIITLKTSSTLAPQQYLFGRYLLN
jgi:hypothetical protein|uniref:Uncharacterized protein n=1 Tax=viral metagenome TaxID=1070528 RepID=A0A6C0BK03_9ZZZZ